MATSGVQVVDRSSARIRSAEDAAGAALAAAGVVVVLLLAVYAHATTSGVAQDVQGIDALLGKLLVVPVAVLAGAVAVLVPVTVLLDLAVRRSGRLVVETVLGGLAGAAIAAAMVAVLQAVGNDPLTQALTLPGSAVVSVPLEWATIAGLLTVAGPRSVRRSVAWSQNAVGITIGVQLVAGRVSLPGVAVALLLGRLAGCLVRLVGGVPTERAYGSALVEGLRRVGIQPRRLTRLPGDGARTYEVTTDDGELALRVLDGDRQVLGVATRLWRSLRLRGIEGRAWLSLRQAAERAALVAHAARVAGVRTPLLLAVGQSQDSMLLVSEPAPGTVLAEAEPSDEVLVDAWRQLAAAHHAGLAHRTLDADAVRVDDQGQAWLLRWDDGDLAVPDLTRRIDEAQMLAVQALAVGVPRALRAAREILPAEELAAVAPVVQPVVMPRATRAALRERADLLPALREALAQDLGESEVEPVRLTRFSLGTLLTVVLPVVALVVLLARFNVDQVVAAVEGSDWRWSLVSFGLGLATFVGAALTVQAFSPVRLPLWRVTLVQAGGAFLALAAPAHLGAGALNVRLMVRRGVAASLAVATVALVQISQFVVTLALLVVLSVASGSAAATALLPSEGTLELIAAAVLLLAVLGLIAPLRRWALGKIVPMLEQVWPRLIDVLGEPGRVVVALLGNAVLTVGWVLAFDAALAAFGIRLSLIQVAVIYFAGNLAGSAVPTPGGLGGIEFALIGLLTAAGVNAGVAASAVLLFRVATYWLQIPIGWGAMRLLHRAGEL
ncbi:lysylphosphatidylglycerol synthase transmembrane domain-containing protein [Isoptericola sp. b490]|uniref:lysylphosphatidylglycerol synthase transmembrane domain-containing protein n=1 Tax=Actinotalea lenta TaxID=3064654 RepID=UPI00271284F9|nr:lysylphosphatidylglycerol synthase transmembrane domain-containing protein [Isoptericola sp. b490]MDO8121508.1 lysylphosphatidylglycerol synthase transmembrane domain-containing protein [Isoptericola sp. b490]